MRFNGGLPETRCGAGSTVAFTAPLRTMLPDLFRELGVTKLLDAPCGDCNWISKIVLGVEYIGCDLNAEHLSRARSLGMDVMRLDVVSGNLPAADLMLCRDFHQHLPNRLVLAALANFRRSGISWLLATSHDNERNDDIRDIGGFRPINLTLPPFSLGEPERVIPDGQGRILGLWR